MARAHLDADDALRVFVKGDGDLRALLPVGYVGENSSHHRRVITDQLSESFLQLYFEPSDGIDKWLQEMGVISAGEDHGATAVFDFQPDVVFVSIEPDIDRMTTPESESVEDYKLKAQRAIATIRQQLNANIFWLNTTTVDLDSHASNYHGLTIEPRSLRVQRLSLALIELSHQFGISIIDVDRVLAEAGVRDVIESGSRLSLIRGEIFRVLEDYGYFDERSIAVQVGHSGLR